MNLPANERALHGHSYPSSYECVAAALTDSVSIPEINTGQGSQWLSYLYKKAGRVPRGLIPEQLTLFRRYLSVC